MGLSYQEFAARYTGVVVKAESAWNEGDPHQQLVGLSNAENALAQADKYYPQFVDRLALLGPELGGTVLTQIKGEVEL